jgi:hypothetical protein
MLSPWLLIFLKVVPSLFSSRRASNSPPAPNARTSAASVSESRTTRPRGSSAITSSPTDCLGSHCTGPTDKGCRTIGRHLATEIADRHTRSIEAHKIERNAPLYGLKPTTRLRAR